MRLVKALTAWMASFGTRWHSGQSAPYLAHTGDTLAAHSGRCGILALSLWPDASFDLIKACLIHDLGESASGDISHHAKRQNPEYAAMAAVIEAKALADMGLTMPALSALDAKRLKLVDRMDAARYARLRAPQIMDDLGWPEDEAEIERMYAELVPELTPARAGRVRPVWNMPGVDAPWSGPWQPVSALEALKLWADDGNREYGAGTHWVDVEA